MALQSFFMNALLFNWSLTASAHAQANDLGKAPRAYPQSSSSDVPQLLIPTNRTTAPPLPPAPIGIIQCFPSDQSRQATDVDGCRPTLNYFRTFPKYRLIQDFMEGRYPKLPYKPPYAVHQVQSTCAVQIASGNPLTIDDFSFEQARALATEILEVCQDRGGRGGSAPIGHGVGWRVSVIGFRLPPDPPDRTGMREGVGFGNITSVAVRTVEA